MNSLKVGYVKLLFYDGLGCLGEFLSCSSDGRGDNLNNPGDIQENSRRYPGKVLE